MNKFQVEYLSKPVLKEPILIEGLPGIGNVGKIAMDFLVENVKAKKVIQIYSHYFPHSVFINEKNLIDIPVVSIYSANIGKQDFLFLAGDIQPIDEPSCYEFCETIIDILQSFKGKEVITLGGIGLQKIPKKPKVYVTGTNKAYVKSFPHASDKIYGVVGPIIGVTGVLLGVAQRKKMTAAALLAQTFAHPAYLGIKGAKETLYVLNEKFHMKMDLAKLSEEIDEIEKEILSRTKDINPETGQKGSEANYFG
ncbi:PAC2 family protein [Candidatus Woesearchaeota archaeon]|nr:PAC2 family protein [Candidatus Woesearchaeota archaeon]